MNADTADQYYAAVLSRDKRFDGKFFLGVKTTGIYCRPICPARPQRKNVEFFSSAFLAEQAGYRPCLRCRPEAAPLSKAWYGTSALVQRALRMIIEVGMGEESEEQFATRFGVTARHLRRLFRKEIGKTPKQCYQDQRLNFARKMVVDTSLPITDIAYASGFQSLRQFHTAYKKRFARAPLFSRKKGTKEREDSITLWLSYRPPLAWADLLTYLKRHAVDGIEEVTDTSYRRYEATAIGVCDVLIQNHPEKAALSMTLSHFDKDSMYSMIQKVRRLFDLEVDPLLIATVFSACPVLSSLYAMQPGIRSPGCWDPFETAVSIILGQLVSNSQAKKLVALLVSSFGKSSLINDRRILLFPSPDMLARADFSAMPMTRQKGEAIRILSEQICSGKIALHPYQDTRLVKEHLLQIPGIGPWTVEYIGMRCLSDPDSFPASDLILRRALKQDVPPRIEKLRPFRSYAAYLLWKESGETKAT